MYCRKCGKQIDEGSKFCPYCGSGVKEVSEDEGGDKWQEDTLTGTGQEKKPSKKWLIPVGVVAGIAVVATVGVLAMNLSKSEPMDKKVVTEQKAAPKKQEKPEGNTEASTSKGGTEKAVEEAAYPKEITLESDVQSEITEFIRILGNVDCKMCGGDGKTLGEGPITQTIGTTDFGFSFIYMSLYNGIPFINGEKVQNSSDSFAWQVSEKIVNDYLQNSINTTDYKKQFDTQSPPFKVEQGTVYFAPFDPDSMWTVEQPQIDKVMSVSDKEIQIDGSIRYTYMEGDVVDNKFQITLTANPNSMWGGYTLKEINNWGEVENSDQPQDVNLDDATLDKLKRFIHLLTEVDWKGSSSLDVLTLYNTDKGTFGKDFLFFSLKNEHELTTGRIFDSSIGYWEIKNEELDAYLKNSVNSTDFDGDYVISASEGCVHIGFSDAPYPGSVESIQFLSIAPLSETDIQIKGTATYFYGAENKLQEKNFDITMTFNPDSVWGGYTLKAINSWGEGTATAGDYVLPDIVTRYYSEDELSSMDAHTLYLARNELFARHGYIFNNADLKTYFGKQSWYSPTVEKVPDSNFNQYEKANLDLIIAVEERK